MKNKRSYFVLAFALPFFLVFGFAACDANGGGSGTSFDGSDLAGYAWGSDKSGTLAFTDDENGTWTKADGTVVPFTYNYSVSGGIRQGSIKLSFGTIYFTINMSEDPPTLTLTIESKANGDDPITLVFTFEGEAAPDTPSDTPSDTPTYNDSLAGTTWMPNHYTLVFTDDTNGTLTDTEGDTLQFTYEFQNDPMGCVSYICFDNSTSQCEVVDNVLYYYDGNTYRYYLISGSVETSLAGTTWVYGDRLEFTDGTKVSWEAAEGGGYNFPYQYSSGSKSGTLEGENDAVATRISFTINGNTLTLGDETSVLNLNSGSVGYSLAGTTWVTAWLDTLLDPPIEFIFKVTFTDSNWTSGVFTDDENWTDPDKEGDFEQRTAPVYTYTYNSGNHTGEFPWEVYYPPDFEPLQQTGSFTVDVNKKTLTFKFPRQIPSPSYTLLE